MTEENKVRFSIAGATFIAAVSLLEWVYAPRLLMWTHIVVIVTCLMWLRFSYPWTFRWTELDQRLSREESRQTKLIVACLVATLVTMVLLLPFASRWYPTNR